MGEGRTFGMKPKILYLAHLLPWPLTGGAQIKSYHTLQALSAHYEVTMLALVRSESERVHLAHLAPLCTGGIETFLLPRGGVKNKLRDVFYATRALLTNQSFLMTRDYQSTLWKKLRLPDYLANFAAIHVDHLQMMPFVPESVAIPIVLEQHNAEFLIPKRLSETVGNPLMRWYAGGEWRRLQRVEAASCERATVTLVVSEEDRALLQPLAPQANFVLYPIGVDTDYFSFQAREKNSQNLLSIGTMYWPPNVDAMVYFCDEILPLIHKQYPQCTLQIVGPKPVASILQLAKSDDKIEVTGFVDDVRVYAQTCGVFIVPLRSGSGMRVKILTALAMGLPVVSTTVGAEGIDVVHGEHLLLADTPQAFAESVIALLDNPQYADQLGREGCARMQEQYSWSATTRSLLQVYDSLLSGIIS
jgi:polysaccharide biosynthesis protein PslH